MLAASAIASKKGIDPLVLDVAETLVITSYFVIASGGSDRQVAALADAVEDTLREQAGIKPIGREGERERKWILLDFADVVVHIFQPEEREFYRLEKLWSDAPRLELPVEASTPAESDAGAAADEAAVADAQ